MKGSKASGVSNKDLLQLERNASVLEKRLLVCANGEDLSRKEPPIITAMPESSVLGRIKSFLPTLGEANRKLLSDIQERGSEEFNIESVNDTEARYVEMDLALGVADLNTREALAAAELAANGQVWNVDNSGAFSDNSECSDSEEEDKIRRDDINELLEGRRAKGRQQKFDRQDHESDTFQTKRKKIEVL